MMPTDIGIVDLMIGFPSTDARSKYKSLRALAKDEESQRMQFRPSTCSRMFRITWQRSKILSRSRLMR